MNNYELTNRELFDVCLDAVTIAHKTIKNLGNEGISAVNVFQKKEIVTKADLQVSSEWKKYFEGLNLPIKVLTEESRDNNSLYENQESRYLGIGDELDGTFNYKRFRGIIPCCAIFTIFDSLKPRFKDALVAMVLDHTTENLWYAIKDTGCFFSPKNKENSSANRNFLSFQIHNKLHGIKSEFENNKKECYKVTTSGKKELGEDTALFIDRGPLATPQEILRYFNLEQKCWPRNISSAGIHLAGVSSGSYSGWDGFLCMKQKPEELAAGYLLIKEAKGYLITTDGKTLDDETFNWNTKYEIIAAATEELGEKIKNELISKEEVKSIKISYAKPLLH